MAVKTLQNLGNCCLSSCSGTSNSKWNCICCCWESICPTPKTCVNMSEWELCLPGSLSLLQLRTWAWNFCKAWVIIGTEDWKSLCVIWETNQNCTMKNSKPVLFTLTVAHADWLMQYYWSDTYHALEHLTVATRNKIFALFDMYIF